MRKKYPKRDRIVQPLNYSSRVYICDPLPCPLVTLSLLREPYFYGRIDLGVTSGCDVGCRPGFSGGAEGTPRGEIGARQSTYRLSDFSVKTISPQQHSQSTDSPPTVGRQKTDSPPKVNCLPVREWYFRMVGGRVQNRSQSRRSAFLAHVP